MLPDDTPRTRLSGILARHCDRFSGTLDGDSLFSMFASPDLLCREIRQSFPKHFQAARWRERDSLAEALSGLVDQDGVRFLPDATPRCVFDAICSRLELFRDQQASRGEPAGDTAPPAGDPAYRGDPSYRGEPYPAAPPPRE